MRLRQHVNPLRLGYLLRRLPPLELPHDGEVEVEIGCADAQFLFERAAQDPHRTEVGIEIRRDLVAVVNQKARDLGVRVRAVDANANVELEHLFRPGSVARVFINFPDPWFKQRHRKRRLIDAALVATCHQVLGRGGALFFQSDVFDLALDAMAVFEEETTLFANRGGAWSFWKQGNPYGVRSRREEVCEVEDRPIWRLLYDRR